MLLFFNAYSNIIKGIPPFLPANIVLFFKSFNVKVFFSLQSPTMNCPSFFVRDAKEISFWLLLLYTYMVASGPEKPICASSDKIDEATLSAPVNK